jgi:hypothetical protein
VSFLDPKTKTYSKNGREKMQKMNIPERERAQEQ